MAKLTQRQKDLVIQIRNSGLPGAEAKAADRARKFLTGNEAWAGQRTFREAAGDVASSMLESPATDFIRQPLQGATLGWGDEATAGMTALAVAPFSEKTIPEIYTETRNAERGQIERARQDRPLQTMALEAAGGLLTGGSAALRAAAPTLLGRMAKSSVVGGGAGLLAGGGIADSPRQMPWEMLKGGAIGVPMGILGEGVASGLGRVASYFLPHTADKRVQARAAGNIMQTLNRADMKPGQAIDEMKAMPGPSMLADIGDPGGPFERLALGVGAQSGRGSRLAGEALELRDERMPGRVLAATVGAGKNRDLLGGVERLSLEMEELAAPIYRSFRNDPAPVPLGDNLSGILNRPIISGIYRDARRLMRAKGRDKVPKGQTTFESLHQLRQKLDDRILSLRRKGENNTAAALKDVREEISGEMHEMFPGLDEADRIWGGNARMIEVGESGAKSMGVDIDKIRKAIKDVRSPAEKEMFMAGALQNLKDKLATAARPISMMRARLPGIRMVFGDEAAEELKEVLKAEANYSRTSGRTLSGAMTAIRQEAVRDLQESPSGSIRDAPTTWAAAMTVLDKVVQAARFKGAEKRNALVSESVAKIIFEQNPAVAEAALKRIADSRPDLIPSLGSAVAVPATQQAAEKFR